MKSKPYGQSKALQTMRRWHLQSAFLKLWQTNFYRTLVIRESMKKFACLKPLPNSSVESRVIGDLRSKGIAFAHMDELFNGEVFETFEQHYENLLKKYLIDQESGQCELTPSSKPYIGRLTPQSGYSLGNQDPAYPIVSSEALARIASNYLGLIPRVSTLDLWYTHKVEASQLTGSQQWHRDYNDTSIARIFLYFNDVNIENGALQYVEGSHSRGHLASAFTGRKFKSEGYYRYITDEEFGSNLDCVKNTVVANGTAGSLVFCDTSGLHRGGLCLNGVRKTFLMTYTSNYDLSPRPPYFAPGFIAPSNELIREVLGC